MGDLKNSYQVDFRLRLKPKYGYFAYEINGVNMVVVIT